MVEFKMPSLGADMKAGTLIEWRVGEGDYVEKGDVIAEVETEKGAIEIEVFEEGQVTKLISKPGESLPVGTVMAVIGSGVDSEAEAISKRDRETVVAADGVKTEHKGNGYKTAETEDIPKRRVRSSPLARRLAEEYGIDISEVQGSGPNQAVQKADVERVYRERMKEREEAKKEADKDREEEKYAEKAAPAGQQVDEKKDSMRHAIAAAMSRSNREIPHYYLQKQINFERAQQWLIEENKRRSVQDRLLQPVLLVKAVAQALTDVPALNGFWINDRYQPGESIHIGFAISLRTGGLVIPAIHDADLKSIDEIMQSMKDLSDRARTGKLRSSELTDATITITNLGDRGVDLVHGVIYPPQLALVGFGRVEERPWAENGMLGIKPILTTTLAADHRATDGRQGAQFLEKLNQYLQEVELL